MVSVFDESDDVSKKCIIKVCPVGYKGRTTDVSERRLTFPLMQSEPEEMPPEAKMRMKNIGRLAVWRCQCVL